MNSRQNLLSGKTKYVIALLLLVLISLVFFVNTNSDFDLSKREVLLRRIGHEILLQSGDSTSRVLPIKKIADNEYQISFEKEFTFQTDSLVNITQRLLAKDYLVNDYVVNVINCDNSSVAYGYAISKNKKDDIVACIGRKQPIACYVITIKFKPIGIFTANYKYFIGGLLFLMLVGFVFWKSKHKKELPKDLSNKQFTFGSVLFDVQKRQLEINKKTIDLTATETRLLLIFATSPNETIERSRLQKEIWEDEGVIVGRSLDMFISKLRKKLELDPNINIVVIRGKGYKLEVNFL
ncbi:winged helix-turn-helix domain-containing protein [Flavobacterium sp. N2820]|uniref:winged helix-turn-helix domain-containing protein n=1 Tax=Flavobacterium sp. N2820 TaxID=2986834 RepID=UPI00222453F0|nr:winged helix-turn-helix domain-containing protein [Flavobacterium sp. N2820]